MKAQRGKPVVTYGVLLAAGTLALQWLDYRLARVHPGEWYYLLPARG